MWQQKDLSWCHSNGLASTSCGIGTVSSCPHMCQCSINVKFTGKDLVAECLLLMPGTHYNGWKMMLPVKPVIAPCAGQDLVSCKAPGSQGRSRSCLRRS